MKGGQSPTEGPTVTRTVRIDRSVDQVLRRLSDQEGLSVNLLVNRALQRLVEWDVYAEKFGFVLIPGSLLARLLESLTEEQARELGRWSGANVVPEYVLFWYKELTLDTLRQGLATLASQYARPFEYEEGEEGGAFTAIVKHGMGARASTFFAELLRTAFDRVLDGGVRVDHTENQVSLRFVAR